MPAAEATQPDCAAYNPAAFADSTTGSCGDGSSIGAVGSGPYWRPYVGVEATFFSPSFKGQPDSVLLANPFTATNTLVTGTAANDSYFGLAPRLWVGVSNCAGWGARVRYWSLGANANALNRIDPVANPADLVGFNLQNSLRIYTLDVEATKAFERRDWNLLASVGVRNAGARRASTIDAYEFVDLGGGPLAGDFMRGTTASGGSFDGTGLTFGLQGVKNICCTECGNFGLFLGGRGSTLWGNSGSYAISSSQVLGPGVVAASFDRAYADGVSSAFITELQAGMQWTRNLTCCNAQTFLRVTFEYQNWTINNAAITQTASFSQRAGANGVLSRASGRSLDNLELFGVGVATGFYW